MIENYVNVESKDCYIISIGDIGFYKSIPNTSNSQYLIEKDVLKASIFETRESANPVLRMLKSIQSIKERNIKVKLQKSRISITYQVVE